MSTKIVTYKREFLLNALSESSSKIPQKSLPATIDAIYVFGSILREKEIIHDVDLIINYFMSKSKVRKWMQFLNSMKDKGIKIIKEHWQSLKESQELLWKPYWDLYDKGIQEGRDPYEIKAVLELPRTLISPFRECIQKNPLKERLEKVGIPIEWLKWISWNKILNGTYSLDLCKVLSKILFEKQKGFEIYFATPQQFKMGKVPNLELFHIVW